MTALKLLSDAAARAAELAALAFLLPVSPATASEGQRADIATAQVAGRHAAVQPDLHLMEAALEVRLLGLLADVRVVHTVRNDSAQPVDLATRLPPHTESVDRVSVSRDGQSIDLLAGTGCGDEDEPHAGHARVGADEAVADLLQLPPGSRATIDIGAVETLQPSGLAWRVALPSTMAPVAPQARLLTQADVHFVVIVPPDDANGALSVTLRPATGEARRVALGPTARGTAYLIPVADAPALRDGAIELDVEAVGHVRWMTLPIEPAAGTTGALARAAH